MSSLASFALRKPSDPHVAHGGVRWWLAALLPLSLAAGCGGTQVTDADGPDESRSGERERNGLRESAVPEVDGEEGGGMQVEGLRGHLTAYQIQMGVRPHQRALSRCYADRAGSDFIGGRIVFGFHVRPDGTVRDPRIDESALGAWGVEACLLEVVAQMTFDEPEGGEAKITLPLDFDPRKPVATWGEDEVRAARELAAPPNLPPAEDEAEKRRRRKERKRRRRQAARAGEPFDEPASKRADLAQCVEEAEARPPSGLRITVYIDHRGRVTSAGFSARGPIDPAWAECAEARITDWRMSPPATPGVRMAKFEFSFPPDA